MPRRPVQPGLRRPIDPKRQEVPFRDTWRRILRVNLGVKYSANRVICRHRLTTRWPWNRPPSTTKTAAVTGVWTPCVRPWHSTARTVKSGGGGNRTQDSAPDHESDSRENRYRRLTEPTSAIEVHGRRSILTQRELGPLRSFRPNPSDNTCG